MIECDECGTLWESESAADACARDDLTDDGGHYSPSRGRVSYDLGYN